MVPYNRCDRNWLDSQPSDAVSVARIYLASSYLPGVGSGILLMIYISCVRVLWKRDTRNRTTYFLLAYITVLVSANMVWSGASFLSVQKIYIDSCGYPGATTPNISGLSAVDPAAVLYMASHAICHLLADGLLLWRCKVIWAASFCSKVYLILLPPLLLYFSSLGLGVTSVLLGTPNFYHTLGNTFSLSFFGTSLGLNILLTVMIVARMWIYQRRACVTLGAHTGKHYSLISAAFVESAALYSINGVLLLSTVHRPMFQIWAGISPLVQAVSSLLIILRIMEGRSWESTAACSQPTGIVFNGPALEGGELEGNTAFSTPQGQGQESAPRNNYARIDTTSTSPLV